MIFSELYSAYYRTVAQVVKEGLKQPLSQGRLRELITKYAFDESVLNILPAITEGRWSLFREEESKLAPILKHKSTMPLSLLEKQWLKAIMEDPRVKLFGAEFPELDGVEPLFTAADYKVYDKYNDGDDFTNPAYIKRFRMLLQAANEKRSVKICMHNRNGEVMYPTLIPAFFEYSEKDDKFRMVPMYWRRRHINLGRIISCSFYHGPFSGCARDTGILMKQREFTLMVADERNALERVLLHFAHFEKSAERVDDKHYLLHVKYDADDERELVIRVLSFGPLVKVVGPAHFITMIRKKLLLQLERGV